MDLHFACFENFLFFGDEIHNDQLRDLQNNFTLFVEC